jgi:hypothetical protein
MLGVAREALKKRINRVVLCPILRPRCEMQTTVDDGHVRIRRNDMKSIGSDRHPLFRLHHADARGRAQQFRQKALMLGGQMLHQHIGETSVGRQMLHQFGDRLDTAGGCTNAHDRQRLPCGLLLA